LEKEQEDQEEGYLQVLFQLVERFVEMVLYCFLRDGKIGCDLGIGVSLQLLLDDLSAYGRQKRKAAPDLCDDWGCFRFRRLVQPVGKFDYMRSGYGVYPVAGISSQQIDGYRPGYPKKLKGNGQIRSQCQPVAPKLYKGFLYKVLAKAGRPGLFQEIEIQLLVIAIIYFLKTLFRAVLQTNDQSSIHFIPGYNDYSKLGSAYK